jgi:hypothetical protein
MTIGLIVIFYHGLMLNQLAKNGAEISLRFYHKIKLILSSFLSFKMSKIPTG